jgi:hypothetical protein
MRTIVRLNLDPSAPTACWVSRKQHSSSTPKPSYTPFHRIISKPEERKARRWNTPPKKHHILGRDPGNRDPLDPLKVAVDLGP